MQSLLKSAHHKRGFTLVETLIAISVLLLVIIGPMTIAQKSIQSARHSNEEITAIYLAQEALEAVRHTRDSYVLSVYGDDPTSGWYTGGQFDFYDCRTQGQHCGYDSNDDFLTCGNNGGENCVLYYNTETGQYTSDSNGVSSSQYTREIIIDENLNPFKWEVKVTVSWSSALNDDNEVILETTLYDQYERFGN